MKHLKKLFLTNKFIRIDDDDDNWKRGYFGVKDCEHYKNPILGCFPDYVYSKSHRAKIIQKCDLLGSKSALFKTKIDKTEATSK